VRREAARALAAFPAESAVPALLPALSDDMGEVRAAAASSLALVTGQAFGDDRTAWLRWWQARSGGATPAPAPSPDPVR
jgi:HEAT repeat protein